MMSAAISIYRQKMTSVQSCVPGMEFLADECNSSESTGAGSVKMWLVTGETMPLCQIMRPWGWNFGR